MRHSPDESVPTTSNIHLLLAYVADLELEVDRLRKQGQFVQHEARGALKRIRALCGDAAGAGEAPPPLCEIDQAAKQLAAVLRDLQEAPGYHPAHDQVVAIAIRPLAEQVFRWQQRLVGAAEVSLRLELESEHVEWFPARLRHILDNLLSNSLKYRDPAKAESWVRLGVRASPEGYELRVSDNGVGLPRGEHAQVFELFYRAAPARAAGLGVGLAVVKLLVEQSGGALTVDSGAGQGTTFVALLPRYDVDDYLQ
jgi:signal transduction histidine kinase